MNEIIKQNPSLAMGILMNIKEKLPEYTHMDVDYLYELLGKLDQGPLSVEDEMVFNSLFDKYFN